MTSAAGFQSILKFVGWNSEEAAPPRRESRTHLRVKSHFQASISGPAGTLHASGIDLHENGVGLRTWRRLEPGSVVFLHLGTFRMVGFATVRHSTPRGLGFHAGLAFRAPLMREDMGRWRFHHIQEAAGSPDQWRKLVSNL
jgi:hypothetical protein